MGNLLQAIELLNGTAATMGLLIAHQLCPVNLTLLFKSPVSLDQDFLSQDFSKDVLPGEATKGLASRTGKREELNRGIPEVPDSARFLKQGCCGA